MSGNQSRGLIAASKTKGWDPTAIPGAESILPNWDKDQGNLPGKRLGEFTDGTPTGWPDGYDSEHPQLKVTPGTKDFATPDITSDKAKKTTGADPYAGMGGF